MTLDVAIILQPRYSVAVSLAAAAGALELLPPQREIAVELQPILRGPAYPSEAAQAATEAARDAAIAAQGDAEAAATSAAGSAADASVSAASAGTSASTATMQAADCAGSAIAAIESAGTATAQAGIATTKAGEAASSATAAAGAAASSIAGHTAAENPHPQYVRVLGYVSVAIQPDAPDFGPGQPGLWIQTGLGPLGDDMTFWIEDGL